MRQAELLGRDHVEIADIEIVAEGPAAIALSRGGAAKIYSHTDHNEDAAFFALGVHGWAAAVADGHGGSLGAENALQTILQNHAHAWTEEPGIDETHWPDLARSVLLEANRSILGCPIGPDGRGPRTTLAVALARPGDDLLLAMSIGDSHVFRVTDTEVLDLAWDKSRDGEAFFLGASEESAESIEEKCIVYADRLGDARAIVLVTDGLSEPLVGVDDPDRAVAEAVARGTQAKPALAAIESARTLVETALEAHRQNSSGDNVACAVLWTGSGAVRRA